MRDNRKLLFHLMMDFYLATTDGTHKASIHGKMGHLTRKAYTQIEWEGGVKHRIEQLLALVYQEWGFYCDPERYFQSANLYLDQILESKSGMPVSLGAIVLYLAEHLDLPIYPVNFPTQLVLRAELDDEVCFIDPRNGQFISRHLLAIWFEGHLGFGHKLTEKDLARAKSLELAERFNQVVKMTLMREGKNLETLAFIDHLLKQTPEDPYEIRDRGLVLANMECVHAAIHDFDYFIEHCPDDPTAWLLAAQVSELKQLRYPLH